MSNPTLIKTKNHEEIKQWIKAHNGVPARLGYDSVDETKEMSVEKSRDPLTVWFRADKKEFDKNFQELDWEEFFAVFDHHEFTFQYPKDGGDKKEFSIYKAAD